MASICDPQNVNQIVTFHSGAVEYGVTESILQGVLIKSVENPQLNSGHRRFIQAHLFHRYHEHSTSLPAEILTTTICRKSDPLDFIHTIKSSGNSPKEVLVSAAQILHFRISKVHFCVYMSPPLVRTLNHRTPFHTFPCCFKVHFNIMYEYAELFHTVSFSSGFRATVRK